MARRAEAFPSFMAMAIALAVLLLFLISGGTFGLAHEQQKTWCVAKSSSDEATLWENLNYACSQVDCSVLREGCSCFHPDNLMSHASVAMNLYYQAAGRNKWNCCFKNSALVATTDPITVTVLMPVCFAAKRRKS